MVWPATTVALLGGLAVLLMVAEPEVGVTTHCADGHGGVTSPVFSTALLMLATVIGAFTLARISTVDTPGGRLTLLQVMTWPATAGLTPFSTAAALGT